MKDENIKKTENKEKIVADKYSGESAFSGNELNDELERLAETFRQELKKAQEMTEEEFEEAFADEFGIIPDEELCACCGERRKDKSFGENYEYCTKCRANMKKYPLSVQGIIMFVVVLGLAIFSTFTFAQDFKCYDYGYKAEKNRRENKITSAINNYDSCITAFSEKNIHPQRMYLRCAEVVFETMESGENSMEFVSLLIEKGLTDTQAKMPIYNSYVDIYDENRILYSTMQAFYTIIQDEKYKDYEMGDEETYNEIMDEVEGLIEKEIPIVSMDGKTTDMLKTSEPMVRFCQYMFAYASGEYDESIEYMRKVQESAPEYYWLYGYQLGMAELQNGDAEAARKLAENMLSQNIENPDAYSLHSAIDRMTGKYAGAIKWAEQGLEYNTSDSELYRYKAMAHIANDEYEKAQDAINKSIELKEYALAYMTAIVIENELGNTDKVKTYKQTLKDEEVEFTDRMNDYLEGKVTAKEMFTEGTGDVG